MSHRDLVAKLEWESNGYGGWVACTTIGDYHIFRGSMGVCCGPWDEDRNGRTDDELKVVAFEHHCQVVLGLLVPEGWTLE